MNEAGGEYPLRALSDKNSFCNSLAVLYATENPGYLSLFSSLDHSTIVSLFTPILRANFENVGQLKPRAAVKTSGVVVGRVASIHYDNKEHRAVVELDIQKEFPVDKDSTAQVLTAGVLGEQYLGIEPGGNSQMLKNNEVIMQTQGAFVLEKLISDFIFNKSGASANDAEKTKDPLE